MLITELVCRGVGSLDEGLPVGTRGAHLGRRVTVVGPARRVPGGVLQEVRSDPDKTFPRGFEYEAPLREIESPIVPPDPRPPVA